MTKTTLLTGATGFIGGHIVKELLKSGKKVRCFTRSRKNLPKNNKIELFIGDIKDSKAVEKAVKGCDSIIHLAAIVNPYHPEIMSVNVEGTRNLVEVAKKFRIRKFVFLSTENVLLPYQTTYSRSKLVAEGIVRTLKNYVILRPCVVYGEGDNKNFASIMNMIKKMHFILIPGSGNNKLQPLYVGDLAVAIRNSLGKPKGTYMVAGNSFITLNEFVKIAEKKISVKRIKIHIPLFILYPLVYVYERIFPKPAIRFAQIQYLCSDHVYDVSKAMEDLKYVPVNAKKCIEKIK